MLSAPARLRRFRRLGTIAAVVCASQSAIAQQPTARADSVPLRADYRDLGELLQKLPTVAPPALDEARALWLGALPLACLDRLQPRPGRGARPAPIATRRTRSAGRRRGTRPAVRRTTAPATSGFRRTASCPTTTGSAPSGAATTGTPPSARRGSPSDFSKAFPTVPSASSRARSSTPTSANRISRANSHSFKRRQRRSIQSPRRVRADCSSARMDSPGCSSFTPSCGHGPTRKRSAGRRTSRRSQPGWPTVSARTSASWWSRCAPARRTTRRRA